MGKSFDLKKMTAMSRASKDTRVANLANGSEQNPRKRPMLETG